MIKKIFHYLKDLGWKTFLLFYIISIVVTLSLLDEQSFLLSVMPLWGWLLLSPIIYIIGCFGLMFVYLLVLTAGGIVARVLSFVCDLWFKKDEQQ